MVHWKDIYGVDGAFNPIDLNAGLDLTALEFSTSRFVSGNLYHYRVKYRDHNTKWSDWSNVLSFNNVVSVEETSLPLEYKLEQNYPNPFNPTTQIKFGIKETGAVEIKVYDVLGNLVSVLLDQEMNAGNYNVTFNASNLSSGIYFYKLRAGFFSETKKMLLMK